MSALERIGTVLMTGKKTQLSVRSEGPLVTVVMNDYQSASMTVTEAKAWREGLSRAIRQAEAAESSK